jgi:tetratricopeptide (TPR) repeat protein
LSGVLLGGAVVLLMNAAHAQVPGAAAPTQTGSGASVAADTTPATMPDYSAPAPAPPTGATSTTADSSSSPGHSGSSIVRSPTTNFSIVVAPPGGTQVTVIHPAPASTVRRSTARRVSTAAPKRAVKSVAKSTPAPRRVRSVSKARQTAAWKYVERGTRAMRLKNYSAALADYQRAVKTDPNNPYALSGVADNLLVLGRYAAAESAYRRALARTPGNVKLLRGLGDSLVPQRKYSAAIAAFKQVANKSPRDFAAMYQLAQILTWSHRYSEAEPYYRRALTLDPNNVEAWTAWGESLSFAKDYRARDAFNRAIQLRPNYARALAGLGNVYAWNNEYAQAENAYRRALAAAPRSSAALIGVGDALSFTSRSPEAIPYYQRALLSEPANLQARLGLGRALVQAKREKEAVPYLRQVLAREPGNADALQLLAQAQAAQNGTSAPTAITTLQNLLARQTLPAERAQTLLDIAQLQARAGDFKAASASYTKAIQLAPNDSEVALAYAQALVGEGEWDEAGRVVSDILRRDPANTRALIMQVAVESKTGTPERAAALANRLLALNVTEPQDALILANALRAAGNRDGAQQVLKRLALEADTADPAQALEIATAVRDAGMYELAQPMFEKILAASPKNAEARLKLGEMLLWQNQYDAAQKQADLLLTSDPNNVEARVLVGTIALRRDEKAGAATAEREANAILAVDSRNVAAGILIGQVQSLRERYADAVATYRKAVDAEPNNLEARVGLARNLYYARQTPEAIEQYRELIKRAPADASIKLELAKIYLDQNQLSDAEALYADVLAANGALLPPVARSESGVTVRAYARLSPSLRPLNGEPLGSRSTHVKAERLRFAQTSGTELLLPAPATAPTTTPDMTTSSAPTPALSTPSLAPPSPALAPSTSLVPSTLTPGGAPSAATTPEEDEIAADIGLGEVRRRQERYDESIDYFNAALKLDSSNAAARVGLAQALRGKSDYLRALQETERVLATDETNLDARVLHAQLLADTGEKEKAQSELDALVAGLPDRPTMETYLDLSTAFVELKNYDAALQLLHAAEQDYPERVEVQERVAETLTFARRWDDALAAWDKIIALDPKDTSAILGRTRVYNYSSRLTEAEAGYRRVLELEPGNYAAQVELADVLARQSEYPDAIAQYRQAIEKNPGDLKTRVELARVLRYNRNFAEAETVATDVIQTDSRYAPAYTERSLARSALGNYEAAIADARQALDITPSDTTAQLGLAEVLSYTKRYDESIKLYREALEREPENTKAHTELAATLSYAGQYDAALKELDTVLAANPQNLDAQVIKADVLARGRRTKEAVALYQTILREDSRNLRARVGLAEAYAYNRQYDDAIKVYDELIALDPDNTAYTIAKGRTLAYSRRYPQAIAVLRPLVQKDPTDTEARLALAEAMTNSGNNVYRREAVTQYQTVMRTNPDNVDARIGLGRVYSYSGQYKQAESTLNAVLQSYPDNAEARYALAESQRFAGNGFDARENYERVLQREPQNIGALAGLATVRRTTSPSVTAAYNHYTDSNNVRVSGYSVGAQVPTRAGTIGLTAETGNFEDEGIELRRRALTLLLARRFGPLQARLLLSKVNYTGAPDKNLYDLNLQRSYGARKRIYVTIAKRDIVESIEAVQAGITAQTYQIGGEYPVGQHIDLDLDITHYRYSDDNSRTSISPSIYYRFKATNPSFRLGLGYRRDNTRETGRPYYTPQDYSSIVALADYVKDEGTWQYGLFASHPLTSSTGTGGVNRPANTLFGFVTYELSDLVDLFLNGGVVRGPNFDSTEFTTGATVRF